MVFGDITPLIALRVERLCTWGAEHLKYLHGHINMAWGRSIPLVATPPQPDYCVGLGLNAFTQVQYQTLRALIGGRERNPLMASFLMFFPFFTCEVKATGVGLEVANRQNISSGSVTINALITLYRAAGREKELDKKILAFSISHDDKTFEIYGHYASLETPEQRFYRYSIRRAYFAEQEDRWTAYRFTRNVYDVFAPIHRKRVCDVLDSLPENASIWNQGFAYQRTGSEKSGTASIQASKAQVPGPVTPPSPAIEDETSQKPKKARRKGKK